MIACCDAFIIHLCHIFINISVRWVLSSVVSGISFRTTFQTKPDHCQCSLFCIAGLHLNTLPKLLDSGDAKNVEDTQKKKKKCNSQYPLHSATLRRDVLVRRERKTHLTCLMSLHGFFSVLFQLPSCQPCPESKIMWPNF